jgi:hypothetical protein
MVLLRSHMSKDLDIIRVETALSRYPMHRLAKLGTIAIDLKETTGDGERALRWEVSYNSKFGQPGPLAYKVDTLVVNRKIEQAGRPIPRIIRLGSLSEIGEATGTGEKNTGPIKHALHQNASAYITARMTYRTKGGAERTTEIGDTRYAIVFKGETLPDGQKADAVYIVLHDFYRDILDSALTRPLDYDYIRGLTPIAQRWYELASFQVFAAVRYGKTATLSYADFCMYAPQTRYPRWADVRKQMAKVHAPHLRAGYISDVAFRATTDRDGRPDWTMTYTPGPRARAEHQLTRRAAPAIEARPGPTGLESELIGRGVSGGVAAELVGAYPEDHIRAQLEAVDWLRARRPGRIQDVGAYLTDAIRKGYAVPPGVARAREAERAAAEAAARAAAEAAERARKREEQARIEAFWEKSSPDQRARIEAEALTRAGPEDLEAIEAAPLPGLKRLQTRMIRDSHIRNLLGLPPAE